LVSNTKKSNAAETNHLGLWTGILEFYDNLGQKLIRYWVVGVVKNNKSYSNHNEKDNALSFPTVDE